MVLGIGFYLKRYTTSGEDFFLAGREMTAWVAGLSFVSANLGALELMGWAAASYQYGILATHWYWIGAIPAILFLGLILMPFYYISKTHSVPGYLHLRYGESTRALSAISFAFMTVLMSGINMYAMALVMKVVLGWNIHFSIWVSSLTVAVYVALGGLFSANSNEVLQFFLIWFGALLIPILGLVETGGWGGLVARAAQDANDPGVLVLSRFAGAAEDLEEALIVNPYDADEVAQAIQRAIVMPRKERIKRHRALMKRIRARDGRKWMENFLRALHAPKS